MNLSMYDQILPKAGSRFYEDIQKCTVDGETMLLDYPYDDGSPEAVSEVLCPYGVDDCGGSLNYDHTMWLTCLKMCQIIWPNLYVAKYEMSELRQIASTYDLDPEYTYLEDLPSNPEIGAAFMHREGDQVLWYCKDCQRIIHYLQMPVVLELV